MADDETIRNNRLRLMRLISETCSTLARLELQIALPILFEHCPNLRLIQKPKYANIYHFHGLEHLMTCR